MILSIDPGNVQTAYVISDFDTLKPIEFGILDNEEFLKKIIKLNEQPIANDIHVVIEMIASYGMGVGETIFETVFWIGRFWQAIGNMDRHRITRKDIKLSICHTMKAKDSNIINALIDRFAKHDKERGKGTKNNPDWFYGFKKDIWQAYAVSVAFKDISFSDSF